MSNAKLLTNLTNNPQRVAFESPAYEATDCSARKYFSDHRMRDAGKTYYIRAGLTFNLGSE